MMAKDYPPQQAKQDIIDAALEEQENKVLKIIEFVENNFNENDVREWKKTINLDLGS